jgi:hypothetical protein
MPSQKKTPPAINRKAIVDLGPSVGGFLSQLSMSFIYASLIFRGCFVLRLHPENRQTANLFPQEFAVTKGIN